jgi:hypothetical protein
MQHKLNNFIILFFVILTLSVGVFFAAKAQNNTSPDAIAVRVIPNPNHYSALNWYYKQGFKGAPQSLIVDEYEAVRDGRTVYVNAANIDSNRLYTNIYLISFNQSAEQHTTDIFGRLLQKWKFNTNLFNDLGNCSVSTDKECLYTRECPIGEYCDSRKAQVTRDTRRLADIGDIKENLNLYYFNKAYYPRLSAGTYLPNKTLSVWPSWRDTFSKDLNNSLPIDPINKLASCPGFNPATCWNETNKTFAFADLFTMPSPATNAYVYTSVPDGKSYKLCAYMESGYITDGNCNNDNLDNHEPMIDCSNMSVAPNKAFSKFVVASDPDGDRLVNWNITGISWRDSTKENMKEVYGNAPGGGVINFNVSVSDGNLSTSTSCPIKVCTPNCTNRICGSDGCGGTCAPGCTPPGRCVNGWCVDDCVFDAVFDCNLY